MQTVNAQEEASSLVDSMKIEARWVVRDMHRLLHADRDSISKIALSSLDMGLRLSTLLYAGTALERANSCSDGSFFHPACAPCRADLNETHLPLRPHTHRRFGPYGYTAGGVNNRVHDNAFDRTSQNVIEFTTTTNSSNGNLFSQTLIFAGNTSREGTLESVSHVDMRLRVLAAHAGTANALDSLRLATGRRCA